MADGYGGLKIFLELFVAWGVIFFGIWAIPIDNSWRIKIDIVNTVLFVAIPIMYLDFKGKIPIAEKTRKKITFWSMIVFELFQAVIAFWLNIILWDTVEINGIQVVTYDNLATFLFGIAGVCVIVFVIWRIKNYEKFMEKGTKVTTKSS
jgi:hypothetical protein